MKGNKGTFALNRRVIMVAGFIIISAMGMMVLYGNVVTPSIVLSEQARAYYAAQSLATYLSFLSNVDEGEIEMDLNITLSELKFEKKGSGSYNVRAVIEKPEGEIKTKEIPFTAYLDIEDTITFKNVRYVTLTKEDGKPVHMEFQGEPPSGFSLTCKQPTEQEIGENLREACEKYGVDITFATAIMNIESDFRQCENWRDGVTYTSSKGARGIMQIIPVTADDIKERAGIDVYSDWSTNTEAGVYYLHWLKTSQLKHDGKECPVFGEYPDSEARKLVAAAYNWGPGNVCGAVSEECRDVSEGCWDRIRDSAPKETRDYVDYMMCFYDCFSQKTACFDKDCCACRGDFG